MWSILALSARMAAHRGPVSYTHLLFGLQSIAGVAAGDQVSAGQGLGVAGRKLIWEVRIGNKSVDPQKLTRGGSDGLFYRPVGDALR